MRLVQVDAFTAEPFRGNPAAVCLLDGPREDGWLAAVAREMNLSETAFLEQRGDGWGLRWFTPGIVGVRVPGERVALVGNAVTVLRGELLV